MLLCQGEECRLEPPRQLLLMIRFSGQMYVEEGMSNIPLEVSQWGRPPMARCHTVKTGPINLTLEIALFQKKKKKKETWKNG